MIIVGSSAFATRIVRYQRSGNMLRSKNTMILQLVSRQDFLATSSFIFWTLRFCSSVTWGVKFDLHCVSVCEELDLSTLRPPRTPRFGASLLLFLAPGYNFIIFHPLLVTSMSWTCQAPEAQSSREILRHQPVLKISQFALVSDP